MGGRDHKPNVFSHSLTRRNHRRPCSP